MPYFILCQNIVVFESFNNFCEGPSLFLYSAGKPVQEQEEIRVREWDILPPTLFHRSWSSSSQAGPWGWGRVWRQALDLVLRDWSLCSRLRYPLSVALLFLQLTCFHPSVFLLEMSFLCLNPMLLSGMEQESHQSPAWALGPTATALCAHFCLASPAPSVRGHAGGARAAEHALSHALKSESWQRRTQCCSDLLLLHGQPSWMLKKRCWDSNSKAVCQQKTALTHLLLLPISQACLGGEGWWTWQFHPLQGLHFLFFPYFFISILYLQFVDLETICTALGPCTYFSQIQAETQHNANVEPSLQH